ADQAKIIAFCERRTGCFAILDMKSLDHSAPAPPVDPSLKSADAALYGPWIQVRGACPSCKGTGAGAASGVCPTCWGTGQGFVPPSGNVAGIYARTDERSGVHEAPANEPLTGVFGLQARVEDTARCNRLRAFPGRGIRVWGARTLSDDPAWVFVNVRRLFL